MPAVMPAFESKTEKINVLMTQLFPVSPVHCITMYQINPCCNNERATFSTPGHNTFFDTFFRYLFRDTFFDTFSIPFRIPFAQVVLQSLSASFYTR